MSQFATEEEMLKFLQVIVVLHECQTYCQESSLSLNMDVFQASSMADAQAKFMKEGLKLPEEARPNKVTGENNGDTYTVYFVVTPEYAEVVGRSLFLFKPPPLCPSKLIEGTVIELEISPDKCPPKKLLNGKLGEVSKEYPRLSNSKRGTVPLFFILKRTPHFRGAL